MIKFLINTIFKIALLGILAVFLIEVFAEERNLEKINIKDLDENYCPKVGTPHYKESHILFLIDTTMQLKETEFNTLNRLLLPEETIREIPPYTKITLVNLNGVDKQASEIGYIFSKCRPRTGDGPYDVDKASWWDESEKKMDLRWRNFLREFEKSKQIIKEQPLGNYTQIIEMIFEISRMPSLDFGPDYKNRKLVIASDLIQQTRDVNLAPSCIQKQKCISWDALLQSNQGNRLRALMPKGFKDNPPKVQILYLSARTDRNLKTGALEFWQDYFEDAGINLDIDNDVEFESNTSVPAPKT